MIIPDLTVMSSPWKFRHSVIVADRCRILVDRSFRVLLLLRRLKHDAHLANVWLAQDLLLLQRRKVLRVGPREWFRSEKAVVGFKVLAKPAGIRLVKFRRQGSHLPSILLLKDESILNCYTSCGIYTKDLLNINVIQILSIVFLICCVCFVSFPKVYSLLRWNRFRKIKKTN